MKGRNLFLTSILALAVGVALIVFRNVINSDTLVSVGGIFFIAAGVVNMAVFLGGRDKEGKARQGVFSSTFGWVSSAAAVLLGLSMLVFHDKFVGLVNFMFAVLIAITALYQLFLLIFGARPVRLPQWLFIAPVLLVGAAVYLFIPSVYTTDPVVMITTGASFIVFGLAMLVECFYIGNSNRRALKASRSETSGNATVKAESDTEHQEAPVVPESADPQEK